MLLRTPSRGLASFPKQVTENPDHIGGFRTLHKRIITRIAGTDRLLAGTHPSPPTESAGDAGGGAAAVADQHAALRAPALLLPPQDPRCEGFRLC